MDGSGRCPKCCAPLEGKVASQSAYREQVAEGLGLAAVGAAGPSRFADQLQVTAGVRESEVPGGWRPARDYWHLVIMALAAGGRRKFQVVV